MFYYGYTVHQAERVLTSAERRAADAQLGRRCAALAQWRRSLASPVRALRRQPGAGPRSPRVCAPVDPIA